MHISTDAAVDVTPLLGGSWNPVLVLVAVSPYSTPPSRPEAPAVAA